jgi:hypothetical protein
LVKILQIINEKDPTKIDYRGEYATISHVIPMDGFNLLGQPSPNKILTPKELADARSVEVNYKSIIEDWNVYRLEGGAKLKTKLVIASVKRLIELYDTHGMPLYNINAAAVTNLESNKKP